MESHIVCPACGHKLLRYRNPLPTIDIIIRLEAGIVLIKRKNPPLGWALPGGFIDYGESAESAAKREAKEETGLDVAQLELFGVYSEPNRDPRHHTISVVFTAVSEHSFPSAGDDAAQVGVFSEDLLPHSLAFDHAKILSDYFSLGRNSCAPNDVD